ncbi:hypothetical protein [Saccharopolyspora erythraea]|uniref:hypothetical protein n=1 Tax=Saccharopolyspora erythraea TaxID=1836 RepID=UPI00201260B6|nr:hypothetical protein [Saccharopolyspora erythraea]
MPSASRHRLAVPFGQVSANAALSFPVGSVRRSTTTAASAGVSIAAATRICSSTPIASAPPVRRNPASHNGDIASHMPEYASAVKASTGRH